MEGGRRIVASWPCDERLGHPEWTTDDCWHVQFHGGSEQFVQCNAESVVDRGGGELHSAHDHDEFDDQWSTCWEFHFDTAGGYWQCTADMVEREPASVADVKRAERLIDRNDTCDSGHIQLQC